MKQQVLNLVQQLSNGQADPIVAERLYRDVVMDFGQDEWLTNFRLVAVPIGGAPYSLPAAIIKVMTMMYDDEQLGELTLKEAEFLNRNWRDEEGTPHSYVFQQESKKSFRLDPDPIPASKPFIFIHGSPLGVDFPAYAVCVGCTEVRQDVLFQIELQHALLILEKEFERESDHTDPEFAKAAGDLGRIFLEMVRP